ncbi:MAG: hypothetical protein B7X04_02315 [Parcubacteria group bacterium 21-54-25]|nr:MAG: hypothetical protein B7X04_02315 [Parcubacteria group bacterium 21-54-25]HQU07882.1 hypothetical protein [Candidatus Paceibacterota bacterium]
METQEKERLTFCRSNLAIRDDKVVATTNGFSTAYEFDSAFVQGRMVPSTVDGVKIGRFGSDVLIQHNGESFITDWRVLRDVVILTLKKEGWKFIDEKGDWV